MFTEQKFLTIYHGAANECYVNYLHLTELGKIDSCDNSDYAVCHGTYHHFLYLDCEKCLPLYVKLFPYLNKLPDFSIEI